MGSKIKPDKVLAFLTEHIFLDNSYSFLMFFIREIISWSVKNSSLTKDNTFEPNLLINSIKNSLFDFNLFPINGNITSMSEQFYADNAVKTTSLSFFDFKNAFQFFGNGRP